MVWSLQQVEVWPSTEEEEKWEKNLQYLYQQPLTCWWWHSYGTPCVRIPRHRVYWMPHADTGDITPTPVSVAGCVASSITVLHWPYSTASALWRTVPTAYRGAFNSYNCCSLIISRVVQINTKPTSNVSITQRLMHEITYKSCQHPLYKLPIKTRFTFEMQFCSAT